MPDYTVIIPCYGHPNTKNGIIYIPLDYIERHFAHYGINKETVFRHILEHEKLHIANNDAEYPKQIIRTTREFKKYKRYLRRIEEAALPNLRSDKDEEYKRLNENCLADLEERIEKYWGKFCKHGRLELVEMSLSS